MPERDGQAMEVFFLRHGQTEWNRLRRIQGSTEWTDLSDDGVHDAEMARDGLLARGLSFDRLYSSPYRRAFHTAQIIGEGLGIDPVIDPRLREMSFGPYEGTSYDNDDFVDDNVRACFKEPERYVAPNGAESFDDVAVRVKDFLDTELAPASGHCERVLAVAHGCVLRTVLRLVEGHPLADFWKGHQPNCCAHIVVYSGGRFVLRERAILFSR